MKVRTTFNLPKDHFIQVFTSKERRNIVSRAIVARIQVPGTDLIGHGLYTDFHEILLNEPTARATKKRLEEQHQRALATLAPAGAFEAIRKQYGLEFPDDIAPHETYTGSI